MPNNMKKAGIKYSKGGPKTSNYVGNPIGYFNDKAEYGKYMMQTAGETTAEDADRRLQKEMGFEGVVRRKIRERRERKESEMLSKAEKKK